MLGVGEPPSPLVRSRFDRSGASCFRTAASLPSRPDTPLRALDALARPCHAAHASFRRTTTHQSTWRRLTAAARKRNRQDDAGATVVKVCLDERTHGTDTLAYARLAQFQGPSLLVYNDSVFASGPLSAPSARSEQVGKTGRFGVGFNSVYHLTDVPSFVSGRHVVYFDPHATFLPNVSSSNPTSASIS